jgi:predicted Ser/Thr protein kinase
MYSLIVTAKMNDIDPQAWLADVLARVCRNIGAIPFTGVILAHSNEAEWQSFKTNNEGRHRPHLRYQGPKDFRNEVTKFVTVAGRERRPAAIPSVRSPIDQMVQPPFRRVKSQSRSMT